MSATALQRDIVLLERRTAGGSALPIGGWSTVLLAITAVMGGLAFGWPLLLKPGSVLTSSTVAPLVLAAILPLVLGMVVVQLASHEMDVKALSLLGVLTALGAVARPLGAGTAGMETVFFLVILAGRVFGPGFGFVLGNTTLFASALVVGAVGPWLPHQMLAAGFVGLGAGLLPRLTGRAEVVLLALYGAALGFVFGILMDFSFWPFAVGQGPQGYDPSAGPLENVHRFMVMELVTGMGWNTGRSITNVLLITVLGPSVLRVLRRAARRARFEQPDRTRSRNDHPLPIDRERTVLSGAAVDAAPPRG